MIKMIQLFYTKTTKSVLILLIFILFIPIKVEAISTYSGGTITLIGSNDLPSVYSDINNESIFSKSGNNYTLKANITINADAILNITNTTLFFIGSYRIWTKGALYVENSTITSINKIDISKRGWIMGRHWSASESGYILQIRNSTLSYLGPTGLDEFGEGRWGIFAYPFSTGDGLTRAPVIIENNDISHLNIVVGSHTYSDYIRNNIIHDIDSQYNTAVQFFSATFENNTVYNMPNNYGIYILAGDAIIRNNHIYNAYSGSGSPLRTKEGEGGLIIENNIVHDSSGYTAISLGGSTRTKWSYIRNNTIYNFTGDGINTVGNCYLNQTKTKEMIYNNVIYNISGGVGLHLNHAPAMGKIYNPGAGYLCDNVDGKGELGAEDVLFMNNTVYNSLAGIFIEGDRYTNVTFLNNKLFNNTNDILFAPKWSRIAAGNQTPAFINNNYTTLELNGGKYYEYVYADVLIKDNNANRVSSANLTVLNYNDNNYPPLNLSNTSFSINKFSLGINGHTPLPNDTNSMVLMGFWKGNATNGQQNMSYLISVFDPTYIYESTPTLIFPNGTMQQLSPFATASVSPNESWYRPDPNTYQNTTVIQVNQSRTNITLKFPNCTMTVTNATQRSFEASTDCYQSYVLINNTLPSMANRTINFSADGIVYTNGTADSTGFVSLNYTGNWSNHTFRWVTYDVNGDGNIDIIDICLIAQRMNATVPPNSEYDVDLDGNVTLSDIVAVAQNLDQE